MAEMNWGELKVGGNSDSTPYMKLAQGTNTCRIVSMPYETNVHWEETPDGQKKRIICIGTVCPICKAGHQPQKKYQVLVIDRADEKVKILEGGTSIFNQIKKLAIDPEWGNPTKYDVKIMKEGSQRETKYTVMPGRNTQDLTSDEIAMIDEAKPLSEINKAKNIEEIVQMGLTILGGTKAPAAANSWNSGSDSDDSETTDDDWDLIG